MSRSETTDHAKEPVAEGFQDLSPRRIVGFGCNQGFLFFLLGTELAERVSGHSLLLQQAGLLSLLVSLVAGFALIRVLGSKRLNLLFTRPLLYIYAIVAALASLLSLLIPHQEGLPMAILQGALEGIPCALLLTAWGRAFGSPTVSHSMPEVFLGSLTGALLCLLFSFPETSEPTLFIARILPLAGVVNIPIPTTDIPLPQEAQASAASQIQRLSLRMLAGTFFFGAAGGLMALCNHAAIAGLAANRICLVLFTAYLLGCLSLLVSNSFGRGAALNKSYRLAIFIMVAGMLLAPLPGLAASIMPGQTLALAGYLGLQTVLVALFVVMAKLSDTDCALRFSSGFLSLYVGQLLGSLIATATLEVAGASEAIFALAAAAGIAVLVGYVFLFTEGDFDSLSQMVSDIDAFEQVCRSITEEFGLSAREAEILAFALRGRTNERIAQELVIAKSTVDTHLRRIYGKCGVHSRQELLDLAEQQIL